MSETRIIGVAGQQQNGKDTIADHLNYLLREDGQWKRVAFAAKVKQIYCDTFGVDLAFVERWKVINEPPPGFDKTVREALQFIGDGFRTIKGNIWIELALRDLETKAIFSDCRYINELRVIKERGGVTVLVWRPGRENNDTNLSEAQMRPLVDWFASSGREGWVRGSDSEEDMFRNAPPGAELIDLFLINKGTVSELLRKVERIVVPHLRNGEEV